MHKPCSAPWIRSNRESLCELLRPLLVSRDPNPLGETDYRDMSLVFLVAASGFQLPAAPVRAPVARRVAQQPQMLDLFGSISQGITKLQAGDYDEAAVKAALERQIANRPCIMYSTTTCPFCKKTTDVLDKLGAMYTNIELDVVEEGNAKRAELANIVGRTSVPAVFIGGTYVGGCNDGGLGGVLTLHERGELAPMLTKAGALASRI